MEMNGEAAGNLILALDPTNLQTAGPPWVVLFNPYFSDKRTTTILLDPFPVEKFPPLSPWEDHKVLAWSDSAEAIAHAAGWATLPAFVAWRIEQAATKGI
jgi:hypothetical protein